MTEDGATIRPRPIIWGVTMAASVVAITAARIFGAINAPTAWILLAAVMAGTVFHVRTHMRWAEAKGAMSPALRVYNRRFLLFSAIYMVAMIAAGNLFGQLAEGSPLLWALALVPLLPVFGMIWTMHRYLREEDDEFLRHRAIMGALAGLALVLVLSTTWGFLEMFGLVPHVWLWAVFPVWAIGLGVGMCFNRADGGEA